MRVRTGYAAWIVGVAQFFVVHGIAQSAWARPYSWARNNISDLTNAHCAVRSDPNPRYICSPEHGLMSGAFVALGVLLVVGAALTGGPLWRASRSAAAARLLLVTAGVGYVLAGVVPADVDRGRHVLGALLVMAAGNIGLVVAGSGLGDHVPAPLRWGTGLLGAAALTATGLCFSRHYLMLGMGGMERAAAFPLLLWASAAGVLGIAASRPAGRSGPAGGAVRPSGPPSTGR
ncbi:DUF998 domain-containing protein [Streptomyces sp. NBC_00083]|uniref:DUF998 domain-containing protein n=1 Tax=Streptomyces sp. NBC_00083 TaxID=2975647 RepID=UPI0022547DC1|nr:DUF998 domain-containing protein [Streptomyces sp. NBC_00083]MCX5384953.1 DUF998 domain-containing protein [Streptomyces sp. NBC_00083]